MTALLLFVLQRITFGLAQNPLSHTHTIHTYTIVTVKVQLKEWQ